jgi:hypothetical protein
MLYNSWERFVEKNLNQNMSKDEVAHRYRVAAGSFAVAIIMCGLFLGLYAPRWCMFTLYLPLATGISLIFEARANICLMYAAIGTHQDGSRHTEVVTMCPYVNKSVRQRARRITYMTTLLTVVVTLVAFSITYAIEAVVGVTLYG